MDFALSEQQEMLKKAASEFLAKECTKKLVREMEKDEKGYSPDLWKKMADLGWMGLVYPEQYGGSGMTFLDLAVLIEESEAAPNDPKLEDRMLKVCKVLEYLRAGEDDPTRQERQEREEYRLA